MTNKCIDLEAGRLITAYEFDQLDEGDRSRFEEHLMNCRLCLEEVRKMAPLVRNLRDDQAELQEALARQGGQFSWENQPSAAKSPILIEKRSGIIDWLKTLLDDFRRPVIWIPATATAILALFLLIPTSRTDNPYLSFLDYSKPPVNLFAYRAPGAPPAQAQALFDEGMAAYAQDRFAHAADLLEKAADLAPDNERWQLYLGVSRYLDRHPQAAISPLERGLVSDNKRVQAMARWYLAQAWLAQNNPDKARPLLDESVRQGDDHAPRADSLLKLISQIK